MRRPLSLTIGPLAALLLASAGTASADQAIGLNGPMIDLAAGEAVLVEEPIFIGKFGTPNVLYQAGDGFDDGETLTATVTDVIVDSTAPVRGAAEIAGPLTATAVVGDGWASGDPLFAPPIIFDPPIQVLYSAPSRADLQNSGCTGTRFVTVAVVVEIVGDFGSAASIDPASELPFVILASVAIPCPVAAPTPATVHVTPPPTDGSSPTASTTTDSSIWLASTFAIGALGAVLVRGPRRRRRSL